MKSKRGFTLIELIIVLALLSIVGLLMYSVFGQGISLYAQESKLAHEQTNMRQVLSDITNKARISDPQTITYESGELHIGTYFYKYDSGTIKRNDTVIANDIDSFEVIISEVSADRYILEIEIVNTSGRSMSTSISLERWIKIL